MKIILVISLLISFSVFAKNKTCSDLVSCINKASKLTGKKYFFGKDLKGSVNRTTNLSLDKENADDFISMALDENGYTRVPLKGGKSYRIIRAREIRFFSTPMYTAGTDMIPDNDDYIMVTINFKSADSTEISRSFRPFMSKYGRVIDVKLKNKLIVQDKARNIQRLINLVKSIDLPLTSEEKERSSRRIKHRMEIEKINAKNCSAIRQRVDTLDSKLQKLISNNK